MIEIQNEEGRRDIALAGSVGASHCRSVIVGTPALEIDTILAVLVERGRRNRHDSKRGRLRLFHSSSFLHRICIWKLW